MGEVANTFTAPFGVKFFSGGPYADAGLGDKALAASAPLGVTGTKLLTEGQGALPSLWQQWSDISGVANPMVGTPGAAGAVDAHGWAIPIGRDQNGNPIYSKDLRGGQIRPSEDFRGGGDPNANAPGVNAPDPYGLSPIHMADFQKRASGVNARRKQLIEQFRANASGRGLSGSGLKAYEQMINHLADTEINQHFNDVVQGAHAEKMNAIGQGFGQANTQIGEGGNLVTGNVNTIAGQAQAATQRTNQANANTFSAIGAAAGGVPIPKKPTPAATPAAAPGPMYGPAYTDTQQVTPGVAPGNFQVPGQARDRTWDRQLDPNVWNIPWNFGNY